MTIYKEFTPTYLYIKQHSITAKLYFGKTVKDPEVYKGSGSRWTSHIKKHGKEHVETLWYSLFTDQESCTAFALLFSEQQRIVESSDWLNLIPENGIDGWYPGTNRSEETKQRMSAAKLNMTEETKAKLSAALKGKPRGPYYKKSKEQL